MTRKIFFRWAVLTAFFFAVGFTYEYHLPQIESWLLVKVEELADKHAPVQVRPEHLHLSLFPLGVVMQNIEIVPKKGLDKTLAPTQLRELALGINIWALIRGEVRLSHVILRNSEVTVFLKSELFEKKSAAAKATFRLEDLRQIPIDEISLENMTLMGRVDPQGLVFRISSLDADVVNLYNSIYLYFGSPSWQFKPAGPFPTLNLEVQGRGLVDPNELRISALKVKSEDSFLVASGLLSGDMDTGDVQSGRLSMRTHFELGNIANWARVLPHPPKLPTMSGLLNLNTDVAYKGQNEKPDMNVHFDTKDVVIDKFTVGDVAGAGLLTPGRFDSEQIVFKNEAGHVSLNKMHLQWKPDVKFEAEVTAEQLELHQLLENLGVHHVPVHVDITGKIPCKGSYGAHLDIRCEGELQGSDLEVRSASGKKIIVKAKKFSAKGFTTIDEGKLKYEADAILEKQSKGHSTGTIDFDKGFLINFEGDPVDFADIENLVDLKLEGKAHVKGSTEGDSDWATVTMNVTTKDFWLEDFGVGNLDTELGYKKGHVTLKNVIGQYGVSRYSGLVDIDLVKDQISIAAKMPFVDLKDVRDILRKRLPIPVETTGTGTAQVTATGPLNIEKLNYQTTSEFYRGTIAKETFDILHFDIDAVDGIAHTKRVLMTKANGQLEMRGVLKPAWTVDAVLVGRALRLEQSELVNSFGLDLQGQTDFNLVLRGPIMKTRMELNGRLSKVIIAEQPQEDSNFRLESGAGRLTGSGSFLGNKVQTQFTFPLEPKEPFSLDLKTSNWDFTSLFSLISKSPNRMDFETQLTMETKLRADSGGFWQSSGLVEVNDLKIRHGVESMQSEGKMKLIFNKGVITSDNFAISAGENFLKLHMAGFSRDHFNADLNGKMNLSLLGLITPAISDLRGNLALSVDMKGSVDKPMLSGSSFIDKAYVKLRDFPHPFSNLRADLLFNQQTLMINAFRSELGGGKLTADGRISFLARDNVPIDVRGSFSDVSLNVPEGFKTRGSGDVAITGPRFPYLLTINYEVQGGEIISEFGGQQESGSSIKASPYLPKFVKEESFEPIRFDIDVKLKKPLAVSNQLLRAQVQGEVKLKGTPNQLMLTGGLSTLPGGLLFFHERPFDITTGSIEYANYPPDDPRIYLTATTHATEVITDQQHIEATSGTGQGAAPVRQVENQYDVSLLVQGRAQPQPQITLTSQPPLSQRDIVSLLALGMTPTALDEQHGSQSAANSAIGAAILQQPVGKKLKEGLGVDLKVGTAQPTATDTAAAPMVTISKQWTPKFSASASSTVGANPTNGVKLEYKMNHSVSVIGSWEDRSQSTTVFQNEIKEDTSNIFGLDLEYKVQFK